MLAIAIPFGLFNYQIARLLWITLSIILLVLSADLFWRYYGGPPKGRIFAWVISVVFVPSLVMLSYGQLGSFMLFGLAFFLRFQNRRNKLAAGIFLPLTSLKPQICLLFWLALTAWVIYNRYYRVLLGIVLSGCLLAMVPIIWNPEVWTQYLRAMGNDPVSPWITPTIGTILRLAFGWSNFWLQLLPLAMGTLWLGRHCCRHKGKWSWETELPLLLFASIISSVYNWIHDLVLLLIPINCRLAKIVGKGSPGLFARVTLPLIIINALILIGASFPGLSAAEPTLWSPTQAWNAWITPALFAWYWFTKSRTLKEEDSTGPTRNK
jgi:hypothetical protein